MGTGVVGFTKTGNAAYFTDSRDRDTAAFYSLNISSGEKTLIAENAKADFSSYIGHPTERYVQAVAFDYERRNWTIIDPSIKEDMEFLKTVADGELELVDRTLDDKIWIVVYLLDDGPASYYYYDRNKKDAKFLFTDRQELESQPLAKMIPVIIKSRDGLDMVSYYTLPLGTDKNLNGLPEKPIPLILLVHGGPWARDIWGYDPLHQWLANRGYAVMSVNFRGSTGLGKNFTNAGNLEWGRKMQEDLLDAVDWAVRVGIADPENLAIMGASYGGYAALAGLTFTPDIFACGVDIVGPSNLITFMKSVPSYWEPQMKLWTTRVGDFRTEEGRKLLRDRSPLTHVDQIKKPLLIGQGANDPRVDKNESDQIANSMKTKNLSVVYLVYPDEGHGFNRPENRLSFYAVAEAFLAEYLGGRYEPIGNSFRNSSITVPIGVEEFPGLAKALQNES
jgi:dipeptidyl aminopeptidase/acylaminoacyl peptidase